MKHTLCILLAIALLLVSLTGCSPKIDQGLISATDVPDIVEQLSNGDVDKAVASARETDTAEDLADRFEVYSELIAGREVTRCDCTHYETTGDRTKMEDYSEYAQFWIELDDGTALYAEAWYLQDDGGTGITDLVIYEEAPW